VLSARGVHVRILRFILLLVPFFSYAEDELDCENAWTTIAINQCMNQELIFANETMDKYLEKSLQRYSNDSVSLTSIKNGQEAWIVYRDTHCDAVYDTWRDGTIRTAMGLGCKLRLTNERTRTLWVSFLTYEDSTPPILPEPNEYEVKSY